MTTRTTRAVEFLELPTAAQVLAAAQRAAAANPGGIVCVTRVGHVTTIWSTT